jgi:hypothetical protein
MDTGEPADDTWVDLRRLPEVLSVDVRHRDFDPPRRITTQGVDREVHEATEIEVRVSEPFGIRALGPVLWVGDEPLTVGESDNKDMYRFFSFTPEALQPETLISLSWGISGPRKPTRYRYTIPAEKG